MKDFLKFIWQFPQSLIALIYREYLDGKGMILAIEYYKGVIIYYTKDTVGNVSLGDSIFISATASGRIIKHEWGHTRQSLILGPLYLIVIGIPSIIWASVHKKIAPDTSYFNFFTEKWADKLGDIN